MFKNIEPGIYFFTGIAILFPFLFTNDLIIRFVFVVIAVILNISTGRKIRVLPNILLLLGIMIANIYPPGGKVYFEIGNFYITQGAISSGLKKSLLLIGSVYISRFAVRKELIFPGKAGFLFYKIFFYFEKLTELHLKFKKNIIEQIDLKLIEIEKSTALSEATNAKNNSFNIKPDFKQILFFITINFLFWGLFIYSNIDLWRS
ncbi:MAG: hypothetical protein FWD87_04820 [Spirochaetaceae bacterium]|nr:hypothetical protein [Spirochaetaceae bacterium]